MALHQARQLRALAEQADILLAGAPGEEEPGRDLNLVEVGVILNRSVHCLDDDDAAVMRDTAHRAGASAELVAAALRLRDERKSQDVTPVQGVHVEPKCKCAHSAWRHVADRHRCTRRGCGCLRFRVREATA